MRRREAALVLGIAMGAGLWLAGVGPYWNITPDSASYVGNARSLAAGRGLEQVVPHPPMAALVYAPLARLAPDSYRLLNAGATVLLLLSYALAYRLLAPRWGRVHALLVVLLSLGSARAFHESTFLLSEPVYTFLSFLALVGIDGARRPGCRRDWAAAAVLVLAVLSRTVGLTLAAAVLVHEAGAALRRRGGARPAFVAMALVAVLALVAWKAWVAAQGATVWEVGFPSLEAGGPLDRARRHAPAVLAVGGVLTNVWDAARAPWELALHGAAFLVFLVGLVDELRRGPSVTGTYAGLYLAVNLAHVVTGGYAPHRFLAPVVPLVFHYGLLGTGVLYRRLAAALGAGAGRALRAVGAIAIVAYLAVGAERIVEGVREEHRSPFGDDPIKRSGGYDAQRLARWLRDHAGRHERFAALQTDMWEVVSGRDGVDLASAPARPAEFLAWIGANGIDYVLVDRALPFAERTVGPAVAAHPDRFRLLVRLPAAVLYRVDAAPRRRARTRPGSPQPPIRHRARVDAGSTLNSR